MSTVCVFVSYSHEDDRWVRDDQFGLIPWLARNLRRDNVEFWYDPSLKDLPGEEFKKKIRNEIDRANFAVLLISQNFLGSDFISEFELPWIRERVEAGRLSIVPILVGPVVWEDQENLRWLTDRQMLPGKPASLIEYIDNPAKWEKVRVEILGAIKKRVQGFRSAESKVSRPLPSPSQPLEEREPGRQHKTDLPGTEVNSAGAIGTTAGGWTWIHRWWLWLGGAAILFAAVLSLRMLFPRQEPGRLPAVGASRPVTSSEPGQQLPPQPQVGSKSQKRQTALKVLGPYRIGIYFPSKAPSLAHTAGDLRDDLLRYGLKPEQVQLNSRGDSFFQEAVPSEGFEIRYEPGYEDQAAQALSSILTETYPSAAFQMQAVEAGRTVDFISIFLGEAGSSASPPTK